MGLSEVYAWWRGIEALTVKELIVLSRDGMLVVLLVYLFTLDLYAAGAGASWSFNNAVMAVLDSDHSAASRELIYRFRPCFQPERELAWPTSGLLERGAAVVILDIPSHFQEILLEGHEPARVQMQVDATNPQMGFLASSYAARIVEEFAREISLKRLDMRAADLERVPLIEARPRIWYNPTENTEWFMSIAELLTAITVLATALPATLVRERERGALEQLLAAPISALQILIAKALAVSLVLVFGASISVLAILEAAFAVPLRGSLALFLGLTGLYAFATAGLGLALAMLARNLAQASLLMVLVLAPMLLLSGLWTAPEALPPWLGGVMRLSPLYHYIDIGYGVLLKGAGLDILWDSVLSLAAFGGAMFGFGAWRFGRSLI